MTSNQVQIKFMISKLHEWSQTLGGSDSKRSLANSEFDYLQEEFLSKRHMVEKNQDLKEKEGYTTANAGMGYEIREGIATMKQLLGKLKQEHRRLTKKKKDPPEVLERKLKIVENCEQLLKDIEDRESGDVPQTKYKATTLTDMKARLLKQIDQNNQKIRETGSDGKLSQINEEEVNQINKWKQKDLEMDIMVDDITAGVKGLRGKVKQMNEQQDEINVKTKKAGDKVEIVSNRIKKDNDNLKDIIKKFKPNRCCMYIAVFLLFTGLIVCIIKLLI